MGLEALENLLWRFGVGLTRTGDWLIYAKLAPSRRAEAHTAISIPRCTRDLRDGW